MRLPLGVLSGIGFIGAGAILQHGERVRGVTTAATIWLVTIIGLCFGGGQLGLGVAGTVIALATLWLLKYVESGAVFGRRGRIAIRFQQSDLHEGELLAFLHSHGFRMESRQLAHDPQSGHRLECTGLYRGAYPDWSSSLVRGLARMPGVTCVDWQDIN
jgi:putative Mg2+ transporter-C (MgtC) family protein